MSAAARLLSLASVLYLCHFCTAQGLGCEFAFTTQPPVELSCFPYNSSLQLQCTLSSPPGTSVAISWFTGSMAIGGGVKVSLGAGLSLGPASSMISTGVTTTSEHAGRCYWCEVWVGGAAPSVTILSSALCLLPETAYAGLTACKEDPANLSRVCVPLPASTNLQITSPSLTQPTATLPPASSGVGATTVNMRSPSQTSMPSPPSSPPPSRSIVRGSQEGLYAAVAVCIAFLLVILILLALIALLCRRRHWKRAVSYSTRAYETGGGISAATSTELNGNVDRCTGIAFNNTANPELVVEPVILASSQLDTGSPPTRLSRRVQMSDPLDHDYSDLEDSPASSFSKSHPQPVSGRFSADSRGIARLHEELEASQSNIQSPAHSTPSHACSNVNGAGHYDHLDPLYDEPPPDSMAPSPDSSKDLERFYYTLERSLNRKKKSEEDGRDGGYAEPRRLGSMEPQKPSLLESTLLEPTRPGLLQEIFDDPKYTGLFVNVRRGRRTGEGLELKHRSLGASPAILVTGAEEGEEESRSAFDLQCREDELSRQATLAAQSMPELPMAAAH